MKQRTPAYWPTRILLAIGVIATSMVVMLPLALPTTGFMGDPPSLVLGLTGSQVMTLVALVSALSGLIWMFRIFRGPRDEPVWRYRDR